MKSALIQEMKKVKGLSGVVLEFMTQPENWVEVDPDMNLAENALLSYPETTYVLDTKKANKSVSDRLKDFLNEDLSGHIIKVETFDLEVDEELLSPEMYNAHCIFAYYYPVEDDEGVNDHIFGKGNPNVFIYNGLQMKVVDDSECTHDATAAINVFDYNTF